MNERGSQRWIRHFVNERTAELDTAIAVAAAGRIATPIRWTSPLASDHFKEYRDAAALERAGASSAASALGAFWPGRGPQWDALGIGAKGESILVEAKAHIDEAVSPPSAASPESLALIRASLARTAEQIGARPTFEWSSTFYQYANRIAHLWFLRQHGIDAWLVMLYFVGDNDMGGPKTSAEWLAAIRVIELALGLRKHALLNFKLNVFVQL